MRRWMHCFYLFFLIISACSTNVGSNTSSLSSIDSFSINNHAGTINGNNINVALPVGTNLNLLVATFTTTGSYVTVGGSLQISGTTENNYTNPITYVVHAADGSTNSYTVTTSMLPIYAIFTNLNNGTYTQCLVNESGIESNTCTVGQPSYGPLNYPYAVSVVNNHVYFINERANSYTHCYLGESGIESSTCVEILPQLNGESQLLGPTGIAFTANYVYIGNQGVTYNSNPTAAYTQCRVSESGVIAADSCRIIIPEAFANSAGSAPAISGIAFAESYVYFTDSIASQYYLCNNNPTTGLIESSTCITTPPLVSNNTPAGVLVLGNYIYFADNGANDYTECQLFPSGYINNLSCNSFITIPSNNQVGLAAYGNYAYFANSGNNSYTQCSINNNLILSNTCFTVNVPQLNNPYGIFIYALQ